MDLILIRHAAAVERNEKDPDAERALTAAGRRDFRAGTLAHLRRSEWSFDAILHSPWRRAAETAALLAPLCERSPRVLDVLAAAPRATHLPMLRGERVAAVGHQPWIGELAALLCWGERRARLAERLKIGKGAALWLRGELSPGGMQLRALWPASPRP